MDRRLAKWIARANFHIKTIGSDLLRGQGSVDFAAKLCLLSDKKKPAVIMGRIEDLLEMRCGDRNGRCAGEARAEQCQK